MKLSNALSSLKFMQKKKEKETKADIKIQSSFLSVISNPKHRRIFGKKQKEKRNVNEKEIQKMLESQKATAGQKRLHSEQTDKSKKRKKDI